MKRSLLLAAGVNHPTPAEWRETDFCARYLARLTDDWQPLAALKFEAEDGDRGFVELEWAGLAERRIVPSSDRFRSARSEYRLTQAARS